eukprot:scaffold26605_cov215-Cylindrotheca_fusiformis.AAC.1
MAGTRLLISSVVLVELLILTAWSLWYGLCYKNDDVLCHIFNDDADGISQKIASLERPLLRPLPLPNWWTTTLKIHLVVEEPQRLPKWSSTLQSWVESSKLDEWPYFGSTEISMQVVPGRQQWWSNTTTESILTAKETDALWETLPSPSSSYMNTIKSDKGKSMDWILYIPSMSIVKVSSNNTTEQAMDENSETAPVWWSSWIRKNKQQLLTVLLLADTEPQDWSQLTAVVGPWLEKSVPQLEAAGTIENNDYIRKFQ